MQSCLTISMTTEMRTTIAPRVLELIHAHLLKSYPFEGVGFVYGQDGEVREITDALSIANSKPGDQRRRFEVHPLDYIKAEKYAVEHRLTLLGVYHSHPDHPAIPSEHDLRQAVPFFSYIIVSVRAWEVVETTSWQLVSGRFEQEEIIQFITT